MQHRLEELSNDDHLSRHHAMSRLLVTTGATTTSKPHSIKFVKKDLSVVSGSELCMLYRNSPDSDPLSSLSRAKNEFAVGRPLWKTTLEIHHPRCHFP